VVFFILLITPAILKGAKKLYLTLRPPPPPPPTVKYGKLPQLYFPEGDASYKPAYTLQTVNGKLPTIPDVAKVYVVQINKSRLLEVDRVKPKARILGFNDEPVEQPNGQTYKFTNPQLQSELSVNIISGSMSYKLNWQADQTLFSGQVAVSNDQIVLEARSFLQNLGILSSDLADGQATYTYYQANSSQLVPVTSLSEANFVRVDIFRSEKDKLPFVTTGGNKSTVSLLFSSAQDRTKRVVEMTYQYSKILDDNFATYPLIGIDVAWNKLQQGQGFVAQKATDQVIVRKSWLAYYESDQPQQFLQPVYVFEGDDGFLGYVPAVDPKYQD
jgi:hypothetical protein